MNRVLHKRAEGEPPTLSFAQERVWFLQQLEPYNPAYNRPLVMRLQGPLDVDALEVSLKRIQERHETLRAVFGMVAGKPTLSISDRPLVTMNQGDLSGIPRREREAALIDELQDQAQLVFDLESEPILRASLLRLAEQDHVLSLVFHHLVFDRWSEEVFRNEIGWFYQAQLHKQPGPLTELEAQYADFARWQRTWIESDVGRRQGEYWMERLSGDLPTLELPIDARRPPQRSHAGGAVLFRLNSDLFRLAHELSRRVGVTLHSTLLTAFLVMLRRYCSQDDILLGIPAAGRVLPETEALIGLFVNTLASRHDLSGDPTVQELIRRVNRTIMEDLSNQDYPFELVVQALNPTRDLRTTPLFQVMFNYENIPMRAFSMQPLQLEPIEYDPGLAQFDLTLEIHDQGEQPVCALSFNQDIFEKATIERMAGHYRTILEGVVADPQAHISDLPLLTHAELPQRGTSREETSPQKSTVDGLHTWFESQVEKTPQAVAVEFESEALTYAALNAQANQLAYTLIDLGVGPDQPVGLCLEPSQNMVVAILGILKAGGAYMPLDPDFPLERLQFMLRDARVEVVVSEQSLLPKLTGGDTSILILDAERDRIEAMPIENPSVEIGVHNLAYVLYTSGSTGEPKGVQITHGNVIQLFHASEAHCRFDAQDIWPLFHSFTFDFSVWECFGALLYGGRLLVIPVRMRRALDVYFEQVVFERLTILTMIPPLFFEAARLPQFYDRLYGSNIRRIFLGGDVLDYARLEPFFRADRAGRIAATNIYGPTETTVFVTWHDISQDDMVGSLGSVIGRSLEDTDIFILDRDLNLLPVGVPGEIVIGGPGVARGYLNRPKLNKQHFIEHPLDPRPGSRFYRTGDVGRLRADGMLEFLGRKDAQVKIRGFRVELGEIEAALQAHPSVAEAVVQLIGDSVQDRILIAYVVLEGDKSLPLPEMRAFLSDFLPEYMIPAAVKVIESIPLTSIGKLDRNALPDLGPRERALETAFVEPQSELEKRLESIWKQVLDVSEVGAHDSFFNLGGHSLMAMQLVARVREQLAIELNVQDVFGKGRTIAGMAEVIETRRWLSSGSTDRGGEDSDNKDQGRI